MYENIAAELEPEDRQHFRESGLTDRPEDYYFAIDRSGNEDIIGEFSIIITPKKLWDTEHCWSDSGWIPAILEKHLTGYYELMEATFEAPQSLTTGQARADLIARGFVENNEIVTWNF